VWVPEGGAVTDAARAAKLEKVLAYAREQNPFWAYTPSDGTISPAAWAFLREVLKPEDVPQTLLGQRQVHASTAAIRCVSGGNRSAKTTLNILEDYIHVTGALPWSMRGWYPREKLRPGRKAVRVLGVDATQLYNTVIPKYQHWCPKEYLANGCWADAFSAKHNRLTLSKGATVYGTIEFLTNEMEVHKMQGVELTRLTIDEECDLDIFRENLKRFATSDRLDVQMGWTPTKGLTWSADLFQTGELQGEARTFDVASFSLCAVTNPAVNLDVLKEIVRGLGDYREVKVALLGSFESLSGLVYGALWQDAVHRVAPFAIPADWCVYRGIDPHMAKPTHCVWVAVDREGQKYVIDAMASTGSMEEVKAEIAERSRGYRLWWSVCDKSADSDHKLFTDFRGQCRNIYKELTRGPHPVSPLHKSEKYTGSIVAGVDAIKKDLQINPQTGRPGLVVFDTPALQPLLRSMKTLERDSFAHEEQKGLRDKIREGPHDDHACLRYLYQYPLVWRAPMTHVPELAPAGAVAVY